MRRRPLGESTLPLLLGGAVFLTGSLGSGVALPSERLPWPRSANVPFARPLGLSYVESTGLKMPLDSLSGTVFTDGLNTVSGSTLMCRIGFLSVARTGLTGLHAALLTLSIIYCHSKLA